MFRFVVPCILLANCLQSFGHETKQFKVAVGKEFTLIDRVFASSNVLHIDDLAKAIKAGDIAGLKQMAGEGKILAVGPAIAPDLKLLVLEVVDNQFISSWEYAECRVIKEGEAVSKIYVFTLFFSDKYMTSKDEPVTQPKAKIAPPQPSPAPLAPSPPAPKKKPGRLWTSADGAFKIEAEFMSMIGGRVKLKRTDNEKEIQVDLAKLSEDDRKWIEDKSK